MDLAAIFARHWSRFAASHAHLLTGAHHRAARAVLSCRTAELGGQVHHCAECLEARFVYHSCNHRSCIKCGGREQKQWAAAQEAKLLPVRYFMLTFTLPDELRRFAYAHQKWFYDVMFKATAALLMDFAQDEKHLGGMPGFTSVLHTWTRQMQHHPHVHVIMPGVALSEDGLRVRRAKGRRYLFPVKALAVAFRHRISTLIKASDDKHGTRHHSTIPAEVWSKSWVVDARAVGKGDHALRYLARYVNKTAVSEPRLLGYDVQGNIRLNCQDSGTGKWRVIRLTPDDFLRRWCLHVLPKGLVRVRHYGLLSAAAKKRRLGVQEILGHVPRRKPKPLVVEKPKCPCCGKEMVLVMRMPRHLFGTIRVTVNPSRGPPE
ncbi:IS91 family transposase [Phragmitibacter flavus]|uniref:IS91 family transposase n=1 Tax=Phragmitibacter flavus TaxID=2576071 RepID=A0A5R8K862_9BACT|nr:IS91 family transposase [Phragmitibacter flavus]TLD68528.1 IS91 family transposase [Phragmitibacter flavus]